MSELPTATMDYETRSGAPLRKTGAFRYANDESTEIMMLAAKIEEQPTSLWYSREVDAPAAYGPVLKSGPNKGKQRKFLDAIELYEGDDGLQDLFHAVKDGCYIEAHNMMFEWAIWHAIFVPKYGAPPLDPRQVRCSAAKAASYSLPRSLQGAGAALGLTVQKDMEGSKLLQRLCKQRKPTIENPRIWFGDQQEIIRLGEYCVTDVDSEHAISAALPDLPPQEWELWFVDQAMNARGVALDMPLINHCHGLAADAKVEMNKELFRLTGIEKTSQRKALIAWLNTEGVEIDNTRGATLDDLLQSKTLDPDLHRVVQLVREGNKTTTAKFDAMRLRADDDNRARDNLMFHAASTGRWGGRGIQLQNLKRGAVKDMVAECDMLSNCDIDLLMTITDNPIDRLSGAIRGMIVPGPDREFIVADYSSIEARGVMWLADDTDALRTFRIGEDIYNAAASDIYGRPVNRKRKEDAQAGQLGKQSILGLGYGMGPAKFLITCRGYGIEFSPELIAQIVPAEEFEEIKQTLIDKWHMYGRSDEITLDDIDELVLSKYIVDRYRTKYSAVPSLWKELENAAIQAIREATQGVARWVPCANRKIHFKMVGNFLACRLPSGRMLWYPGAMLKTKEAPWSTPEKPTYMESIRYMGVDSTTKQWTRQWTYGGKLCENVVQALSRDLMGHAMVKVEAHPTYVPVLTVHDEIITEVKTGEGDVREFEELICELPKWAEGFPLKAEGDRLQRYQK